MARRVLTDIGYSYAFVEYADHRDAEDAYYELHNFRFSRDEILKIEVHTSHTCCLSIIL